MRVGVLRLFDVRNYAEAELRPGAGVTVLHGANGSGKSNLLEALGLFATLSSPRTGSLGVLVREGAEEAGMRLESDEGTSLEIRLRAGRTALRAGGSGVMARTFLGRFRAVLFTPEDLDLVRGEPDLRRRALDEMIVQLRPAYRGTRRDYDRALRQRNTALRQGRGEDAASYHRPLADAGAHILQARRELLADLAPQAVGLYESLAGKGTLGVRYRSTADERGLEGAALADHLFERYEEGLGADLERASTRIGPHRDDIELDIDNRPAKSYASRGEQRSVALGFRLAELRMLSGAVLLLDDVLSELDHDRRTRVFRTLDEGVQVIVATADRDAVPADVQVSGELRVKDGVLHAA